MSTSKSTPARKKKAEQFKLMKQHQMKKEKAINYEKIKQKILAGIATPEEDIINSTDIGVELDLDDIDSNLELIEIPEEILTDNVEISEEIPMVELPE